MGFVIGYGWGYVPTQTERSVGYPGGSSPRLVEYLHRAARHILRSMKHMPRKRFRFFILPTIPVPKFLKADLKKMDDFIVLLRVTPKITRLHYLDEVSDILLFVFTALWVIVALLTIILQIPFLKLLKFFSSVFHLLVGALFFGIPIPPSQQPLYLGFWILVLLLMASIWLLSLTRRAFQGLRGLRQLHRMAPEQQREFALDKFLRVSLPFWLSPSITYDPKPEDVLAVLREHEQATEEKTQAIASALAPADAQPQEQKEQSLEQKEQPSLSMLVSITHCLSFSLLGPDGKRMTMVLTNVAAALLGFFATREPGAWITKEEATNQLEISEAENAFAMQRYRTNNQIIGRARKEGLLPAPKRQGEAEEDQEAEQTEAQSEDETDAEDSATMQETPPDKVEINLFENQIEGQISSWRLTPRCNVEIFPFLTALYRKVVEAQALPLSDQPASLELEQLRLGCHRVKEEYGEGFLSDHMKKGYIWPWALPLYKQYRDQCLSILVYANQRERAYLETCQTDREKSEVIEQIAQLYGWQALVDTGLDLKGRGGASERDMARCLFYYGKVKKKSAARAIYRRYCALRTRIEPSWIPGEALQQQVDEVLAPSGKDSRSRNH
jgi:hypothetical protein